MRLLFLLRNFKARFVEFYSNLEKAFKDEQDAIAVFEKELSKNLQALHDFGLFSVLPLIHYFLKQWN